MYSKGGGWVAGASRTKATLIIVLVVRGWIKAKLNSASVEFEVEVEAELGKMLSQPQLQRQLNPI